MQRKKREIKREKEKSMERKGDRDRDGEEMEIKRGEH